MLTTAAHRTCRRKIQSRGSSSRSKQPSFGLARSKMPGSKGRVLFQGDYELLSSQVRNV